MPLATARRLVAEADAPAALAALTGIDFRSTFAEDISAGARSPGLAPLAIRESASRPALTETVPTGRYAFGEAAMAGRLGAARSPGLAPLRTVPRVSESAVAGFSELGRMPRVEGDEAFHRAMVDVAGLLWPQR
jgi:hypothetical protein